MARRKKQPQKVDLDYLRQLWREYELTIEQAGSNSTLAESLLRDDQYTQLGMAVLVSQLREGSYQYISGNVEQVLGLSAEALRKQGFTYFTSRVHEEDSEKYLSMLKRMAEDVAKLPGPVRKSMRLRTGFRIVADDGTVRLIHTRGFHIDFDQNWKSSLHFMILERLPHIVAASYVTGSISYTDEKGRLCYEDVQPEISNSPSISHREIEVLRLLVQGMNSKEVADQLAISHTTINKHRQNLLLKTGCRNTAELIQFAYKNRLL